MVLVEQILAGNLNPAPPTPSVRAPASPPRGDERQAVALEAAGSGIREAGR